MIIIFPSIGFDRHCDMVLSNSPDYETVSVVYYETMRSLGIIKKIMKKHPKKYNEKIKKN